MGPVVSSSGTCLSSPFIAKTLYCIFSCFLFLFFSPSKESCCFVATGLQGALSCKLLSCLSLCLASGHPILSAPQSPSSCPCNVAASIPPLSSSSSLMQQSNLTSSCSSLTSRCICMDAPETLGRVLRAVAVACYVLCGVSTV